MHCISLSRQTGELFFFEIPGFVLVLNVLFVPTGDKGGLPTLIFLLVLVFQ